MKPIRNVLVAALAATIMGGCSGGDDLDHPPRAAASLQKMRQAQGAPGPNSAPPSGTKSSFGPNAPAGGQ